MYYVYILRCAGDTLYCGVAADWRRRIREHAGGGSRSARYTRAHPPRSLAAVWSCGEKGDALRLEYRVKRLSRPDKDRLLSGELTPETLLKSDTPLFRRETDAVWENEKRI